MNVTTALLPSGTQNLEVLSQPFNSTEATAWAVGILGDM